MVSVREQKHRLPPATYQGRIAVSFTSCLEKRPPFFTDTTVFHHLSKIILDSLTRPNCDAHVFLLMPDHCHLLIQGNSDDSDLLKFMKDFNGSVLARMLDAEVWQLRSTADSMIISFGKMNIVTQVRCTGNQ
jgi:REP element-mobilizing transposase RayT